MKFLRKKSSKNKSKSSNTDNQENKLIWDIGCCQNIGRRKEQQDSFGSYYNPRNPASVFTTVADGMGGFKNGKEVSEIAVKTFIDNISLEKDMPIYDRLRKSAYEANDYIFDTSRRMGIDMGTTLVAVSIEDSLLNWLSVGDSRIYLLREDQLVMLTEDHNYGYELNIQVANGIITEAEALSHPDYDKLISFLGIDHLVYINQNDREFQLLKGDKLLLCSDGLYGILQDEEIQYILQQKASAQEIADKLVEVTLRMDYIYQDNVTVIVLEYKE